LFEALDFGHRILARGHLGRFHALHGLAKRPIQNFDGTSLLDR
jgi:hypothetical protein